MNKNYEEYIFGKKHLKLTATTLVITLSSMMLFGSIGYLADQIANTNKIGLIIGLVISYPITQLLLNKFIRKL